MTNQREQELLAQIQTLQDENAHLRDENRLLHEHAVKYQRIVDALPVSVQITDADGTIVEVNPFHLANMGAGITVVEDYVGQFITARPSIVAAGLAEKYQSVLRGGTIHEDAVHFPFTSGRRTGRYSNIRGVPILHDGDVIGAVFISEDVTSLIHVQQELERHQAHLEELVAARTAALQEENQARRRTEAEKEVVIQELQAALSKVKQLSGFLPICSHCKKVRDDSGYWQQIEAYVRDHSEAEFSHSLCPECVVELYKDIAAFRQATDRD